MTQPDVDQRLREMEGRLTRLQRAYDETQYVVDRMMRNGGSELFSGHGNQRFGGNKMQVDSRNGVQIATGGSNTAFLYFLRNILADPSTATLRGFLRGAIGATSAAMRLQAQDTANDAAWLDVDSDADDSNVILHVERSGGEATALTVFADDTGNSYLLLEGGPFLLYSAASDHASLANDGAIQYRSDTDKLRLRANGTTENIATETFATGEVTTHTGDTADAHDASAISVLDTGGLLTATDVEAALAELAAASGGITLTPTAQSTAYNAVVGDFIRATSTFTVTLPSAPTTGSVLAVKNVGSGVITIARGGTDTIYIGSSVTSFTLNPGEAMPLVYSSTGTVWEGW